MKLLFITCLKEYRPDVSAILGNANIKIFSVSETTGFKDDHPVNLSNSWFGTGEESYDSLVIFSFTTAVNAQTAMQLIKHYNDKKKTDYPVRAFVLAVEQCSYE